MFPRFLDASRLSVSRLFVTSCCNSRFFSFFRPPPFLSFLFLSFPHVQQQCAVAAKVKGDRPSQEEKEKGIGRGKLFPSFATMVQKGGGVDGGASFFLSARTCSFFCSPLFRWRRRPTEFAQYRRRVGASGGGRLLFFLPFRKKPVPPFSGGSGSGRRVPRSFSPSGVAQRIFFPFRVRVAKYKS